MKKIIKKLTIILLCISLINCGLKGPIYLPKKIQIKFKK